MRQLALFPLDPQPPALPELDGCCYVRLESIAPKQNRFRFYTINWQKTLWEEWAIRCTWGRIGGMGRSQVTYFESEGAVRETLPKIVARRMARGYLLVAAASGGLWVSGADTLDPRPLSWFLADSAIRVGAR